GSSLWQGHQEEKRNPVLRAQMVAGTAHCCLDLPVKRGYSLMQTVFITGASSGLGKALAQEYAAQGACLGLLGRRQEELQALVGSLPGEHRIYVADVRDRDALHQAAQDFLQFTGQKIDVVIASAGISAGTLTEETEDFAVFKAIVDTNLLAMVATFEPFIGTMKAAGKGTLVGIASVAGIRGLPG